MESLAGDLYHISEPDDLGQDASFSRSTWRSSGKRYNSHFFPEDGSTMRDTYDSQRPSQFQIDLATIEPSNHNLMASKRRRVEMNLSPGPDKHSEVNMSGTSRGFSDLPEHGQAQEFVPVTAKPKRTRHQCEDCLGKIFSTSQDMVRHQRTVHGNIKPGDKVWLCSLGNCSSSGKVWAWQNNFKQHLVRMHQLAYTDMISDQMSVLYDPSVHNLQTRRKDNAIKADSNDTPLPEHTSKDPFIPLNDVASSPSITVSSRRLSQSRRSLSRQYTQIHNKETRVFAKAASVANPETIAEQQRVMRLEDTYFKSPCPTPSEQNFSSAGTLVPGWDSQTDDLMMTLDGPVKNSSDLLNFHVEDKFTQGQAHIFGELSPKVQYGIRKISVSGNSGKDQTSASTPAPGKASGTNYEKDQYHKCKEPDCIKLFLENVELRRHERVHSRKYQTDFDDDVLMLDDKLPELRTCSTNTREELVVGSPRFNSSSSQHSSGEDTDSTTDVRMDLELQDLQAVRLLTVVSFHLARYALHYNFPYVLSDRSPENSGQSLTSARERSSDASESGTLGLNINKSGTGNGKKRATNEDDEDNEDNLPTQPPNKMIKAEVDDGKLSFACPYYKAFPGIYSHQRAGQHRYGKCGSVYIKDVSYLKTHLWRVHQRPKYYCPICWIVFKKASERDCHVQTGCEAVTSDPFVELMTEDSALTIKKRRRGEKPIISWYFIFDTLFPGHEPRPISPYTEGHINEIYGFARRMFHALGSSAEMTYNNLRALSGESNLPPLDAYIIEEAYNSFASEIVSTSQITLASTSSPVTLIDSVPTLATATGISTPGVDGQEPIFLPSAIALDDHELDKGELPDHLLQDLDQIIEDTMDSADWSAICLSMNLPDLHSREFP